MRSLQTYFICVDRNTDVEAQRQILGSPYTVIGTTDGGARPHTMDRYEYSTHLLSYWVRDQQIMSLEEAVYRLTGKTALMHDLQDRGFLAPGKAADITIFDPETIASKPREPGHDLPDGSVHVKRDAIGIDYVIVNGDSATGRRGAYRSLTRPGHSRSPVPGEPCVSVRS